MPDFWPSCGYRFLTKGGDGRLTVSDDFLRGYLRFADAFGFARDRDIPEWLPPNRIRVIPPSIDPFSCKNQELDDADGLGVLRRVGLIADGGRRLSSSSGATAPPGRCAGIGTS